MRHSHNSSPDTGLGRFILDLYHEAQEADVDSFPLAAFKKLKAFIGFDSCGIATFQLVDQGRLSLISQSSFNVAVKERAALRGELIGAEHVIGKDGLLSSDPLLARAVRQVGKSHRLDWEQIPGNGVREYAKRCEGVNAMAMVATSPRQTVSSFSLWRSHVRNPFSPADEAVADMLLPHVTQAVNINRKLATNTLAGNLRQAGTLIADHQGVIHHIDDLALTLLRREYPGWLSFRLPLDLLDALASNSAQRHVGCHIILTLRRQEKVFLIAVQARSPGEKLTPAELRVVSAIVRFGSYKEAARKLGVSPATIRNQLHAIYGKLGIRSKNELTKTFQFGN